MRIDHSPARAREQLCAPREPARPESAQDDGDREHEITRCDRSQRRKRSDTQYTVRELCESIKLSQKASSGSDARIEEQGPTGPETALAAECIARG